MKQILIGIVFVAFGLSLTSCTNDGHYAPVEEVRWNPPSKNQHIHRVTKGETLYAVAFRYDEDYRSLAAYNKLAPPYTLRVGQVLQLKRTRTPNIRPLPPRKAFASLPRSHRVSKPSLPMRTSSSGWSWPITGRIV